MSIATESARPVRLPSFPEFVALTASLMAMTALSIDIMLPALPLIRESLGVADVNQQQLVITLYMVGFGIGQLFYGPLSDRFGRKPILIAGLALYAVASAICVFANDFGLLLAARGLQGLANAAPRVIAVAVVRDLYGGRRMAEVMSFVMMVFIIVPAIAPALGSGLLMLGPWHLIFVLLGVVSVMILIWIMLRLPETRAPDQREPLSFEWLGTALTQVLTTRQTIGYTAAVGFIFGGMMAYINSAEQVFVGTYDAGARFPILFGVVALALAAAALVNSRLVMRLGMRRIGHVAACGYFAIALLHLVLELTLAPLSLTLFLCLMSVQLFCFGFVMPNFNALAMEPMGRIAGTASSFIGAMTTCIAAFLGWIIGQSYDGTALPLTLGFVIFGLCGIAIVLVTERGRLFRTGGSAH